MSARGPDEFGSNTSSLGRLYHSRLAITGGGDGHQPFVGNNVIAAVNGQIYNYAELIRAHELSCKTHSDCEVVLRLFEKYGVDGFSLLDGMYAFIVVSLADSSIYLGRDHIGEKPLYFHNSGTNLTVFSELNYLKATNILLTPDPLAIVEAGYLQFNLERTPFLEVTEVRAGKVVKFRKAGTDFSLECVTQAFNAPPSTRVLLDDRVYIEQFKDLTIQSIIGTLKQGDFEPWIGLSGGLDSSLIACVAKCHGIPLNLITATYENTPHYDESACAQKLAEHLDAKLHLEHITKTTLVEKYVDSVLVRDSLTSDSSGTTIMELLCGVKRRGGKVFVTGLGGDELFLDYPWVQRAMGKFSVNDVPSLLKKTYYLIDFIINKLRHPQERLWSLRRYYACFKQLFDAKMLGNLPSPSVDSRSNTAMIYEIWEGYLSKNGLLQSDRYAMHFGIESRTPLVRRNLLEFASRHTCPLLENSPTPKMDVYRRAFQDYLPPFIFDVPKRGFQTPLSLNTLETRKLYSANIDKETIKNWPISYANLEKICLEALRCVAVMSIFYKSYADHDKNSVTLDLPRYDSSMTSVKH